MLNIELGAYRTWPLDECGQSAAWWRPGLSDEEVYAAGRGRWKLGTRADWERYVLFSAMGIVVLAVEIDHISAADPDGRRTILKPGDPVYDKDVGNESPVGKSNPVQYFDSPFNRTKCACGCDEEVPSGRNFLPGRDQRAIYDRVKLVGGVLPFIDCSTRCSPMPSRRLDGLSSAPLPAALGRAHATVPEERRRLRVAAVEWARYFSRLA